MKNGGRARIRVRVGSKPLASAEHCLCPADAILCTQSGTHKKLKAMVLRPNSVFYALSPKKQRAAKSLIRDLAGFPDDVNGICSTTPIFLGTL